MQALRCVRVSLQRGTVLRCSRALFASMASEQPQQPTPRRKQVVTAVVRRPQDGKVLLVRRSKKVGTYKLDWGGISGGIEKQDTSAVQRCLQEMEEEVGFRGDQVAFMRSGRPVIVDDGRLHFSVHPFAFSLTDPDAEVRLNWENVEYAWVEPEEISRLNTVPLMAETVQRVTVPEALRPALERIEGDRSHGAAQLALDVLDAIKAAAQLFALEGPEEKEGAGALDALCNYAYHLATARHSMAPLANSAAAVMAMAHAELRSRAGASGVTPHQVCSAVVKAAQAEHEVLASLAQRVKAQAQGLVTEGCTLLTTSYSSTIAHALCGAAQHGLKFKAIVCESRPLNEGIALARQLAEAGVECTIITDAQAGVFVGQADLVLVGADSLTQAAVVNKVGTYLIALAAKAQGVPVYAVADSSKFSPGAVVDLAHPGAQRLAAGHEEKAAQEVTGGWQGAVPPGVAVRNVYFEPVPLELLAGIVTEDGLLEPSQAAERIERLRGLYMDAFQLE